MDVTTGVHALAPQGACATFRTSITPAGPWSADAADGVVTISSAVHAQAAQPRAMLPQQASAQFKQSQRSMLTKTVLYVCRGGYNAARFSICHFKYKRYLHLGARTMPQARFEHAVQLLQLPGQLGAQRTLIPGPNTHWHAGYSHNQRWLVY